MFSLAVKSKSKPVPNSISGDIFPSTFTIPVVGSIIWEITFKRVLFPAPLNPTKPTTSPFSIFRFISFNAQHS